jgi:uncharacterized DUF497 family protein
MQIRFTKHAEERMKERGLTRRKIIDAFAHPDKLQASSKTNNRFLIKKITRGEKRNHLLLIVFEKKQYEIVVITVIDTSKIDKYY